MRQSPGLPVWLTVIVAAYRGSERDEVIAELLVIVLASSTCERRDAHGFPEGPRVSSRARWALLDVARRIARHVRREQATPPELLENIPDPSDGPEVVVLERIDRHAVLTRMASLTPQDRRLVALRLAGGLTERHVAEVLQVSRATVHRRWASLCRRFAMQ